MVFSKAEAVNPRAPPVKPRSRNPLGLSERNQMPQIFKKILCPIDFDQNSLSALRLATDLAREHRALLYVLHIVAMPAGPEVALPFSKMEAASRIKLKRLARQKVGGKVSYEVEVTSGDPGVEVVQAAKRLGADLIVMATHGRKGLRRFVLGSVAEHVVREASCPVLTVTPKVTRDASPSPSRKKRAPRKK
jgi:universal stress protein A